MLLKETLRQILQKQQETLRTLRVEVERTLRAAINMHSKHIVILSGIRRSGKSTLMRQLMEEQINFLDFEDPKTAAFELKDFDKLGDLFDWQHPCFFDEIQNIPQWERYIRYLHDNHRKAVVTGSNASLLSRELGTKLTGRYLSYEVFPFSYQEFLIFMKLEPGADSFEKYLEHGGFPEYLEDKDPLTLQNLFNDILARDIIVRHNIKQTKLLEQVAVFLISNSGKIVSLNKLRKLLDVKSTNTLSQYLSYLEDCYMVFTVPKYSYSIRKQIVNPKKIFAIDTGFSKMNSLSFSKDEGRMLETSVFLCLRRTYRDIYYFQESHECDFIVKQGGNTVQAIQVCAVVTEENKDREFNGLIEALHECKLTEGFIITKDQEETLVIDKKKITLVPAWKWMK